MNISSDKVLNNGEDLLGRKIFSKEVANGLTNYSEKNTDGITISITGEWGSGKSTLLHYLKSDLEANMSNSFKVIEFNPWILYKEGGIRDAFLIHFATSVNGSEETITAVSKKIRDFVSAFRFLKNINAAAGNIQDGIEKAIDFFSKNNSIFEIKKEIEKLLLKSNKKYFVFIDDIDRLTHSEMLELFQTISLVMNFPNVYYVIAFDKDIVINAIDKEYGNKGLSYLEKIIQLDYPIPKIRKEKLEGLFFQFLDQISVECNLHYEPAKIRFLWKYNGLADYFTTMRDYKLFFNSISFRLPIIAADVNFHDFIAIEAIRLFDYDGYNTFYSLYSGALRKRETPELVFHGEQSKQFKSPTIDIIKAIFPNSKLEAINVDTNLKRIYDSAYFERYFSLLRNEKDISESDFKEFMERPDARFGILKNAMMHDRLSNILTRLGDDEINKHFINYGYDVVHSLIVFFGSYPEAFENHSLKASDAIINLVSRRGNYEELTKRFFLSFKDYASTPNVVYVYFFHFFRLFRKTGRQFRESYYFNEYYLENFDSIYNWYIDSFEKSASFFDSPKYTAECPEMKFLLFINYAELFPESYLKHLNLLINDKGFVIFLLSKFIMLTDDLRLSRIDLRFKELLFPGNTFAHFYNAVNEAGDLILDKEQQAAVKHFISNCQPDAGVLNEIQ